MQNGWSRWLVLSQSGRLPGMELLLQQAGGSHGSLLWCTALAHAGLAPVLCSGWQCVTSRSSWYLHGLEHLAAFLKDFSTTICHSIINV